MAWRVWQWAVEIGQGSHGQTKMSSRILQTGFDNEAEARQWAATQDKSSWGFWGVIRCGQYVDLDVPYEQLPKSYKEAVRLAESLCQR